MYAANIYISAHPPRHTHTHTGAQFIYVAVYYHYHQTRGSKREPGCISLLDAHHHCLSLRCLSSCHFRGSPAGIPTLLCPLCLLQTFIVFFYHFLCLFLRSVLPLSTSLIFSFHLFQFYFHTASTPHISFSFYILSSSTLFVRCDDNCLLTSLLFVQILIQRLPGLVHVVSKENCST